MKMTWLKKALGIGLALVTAAGLCACGNNGGDGANAALAKENVYRMTEFELPEMGGDSSNVRGIAHKDGKIYMMMQVYDWSKDYAGADVRLITMNDDGSDIQMAVMEMPMQQSSGLDNSEDVWENTNYNNYFISANGVYAVKNYYYENYSEGTSIRKCYISNWGMDGSYQWEADLGELNTEEEYLYVNAMAVSDDGTVNLILSGDNAYKMTVDSQGNASERVPIAEELSDIFNRYDRLLAKEDGSFLIIYYDGDGWEKQYLVSYDPITDTLGEENQLPASLSWNGYNAMSAGLNSDLIYSTNKGVFTYKVGDAESTKKMDFINSDLGTYSMSYLLELSDTSFVGVYYDNTDDNLKAGLFNYVDPKDIPDKSVLVLAGSYVDSDIKRRVISFNRSSEKYRIVVKEYDAYNSYDDYNAGVTQLNNDIITGNMPDILITANLPTENYISKGWLADIGKLIEDDEELSKVEFVQNVFDAYSVDGKLYYVIPCFTVNSVVAKTSLVGDRSTWTMAEAQQILSEMPEGAKMFGDMERGSFFSIMMDYCGSDFVDVETGKCDFDSQNFIGMMEYAKTLPETIEYDEGYWESYWQNYQTQYRENRTLMMRTSIGSFTDITYEVNGMFGEEVSYVGFPTDSGEGSYVNANVSYALSAGSKNLDGAWEFIRYYLTDEYQSESNYWGLSVQKKYLLENAQEATKRPTYTDEDGNEVEYDYTYWLSDEEIILPPMTQEQVDKVINFVYSINKRYYYNENIINIINEEMDAYFSGQKSAQDVAQVIQSRAQIYVDENR